MILDDLALAHSAYQAAGVIAIAALIVALLRSMRRR